VKLILSTPGCDTSAAPASSPKPVTKLTTPSGTPASSESRASSAIDSGVCSAGLITIVQPLASAGASFLTTISNGRFQGVIAPTTPTGWRSVEEGKGPPNEAGEEISRADHITP